MIWVLGVVMLSACLVSFPVRLKYVQCISQFTYHRLSAMSGQWPYSAFSLNWN